MEQGRSPPEAGHRRHGGCDGWPGGPRRSFWPPARNRILGEDLFWGGQFLDGLNADIVRNRPVFVRHETTHSTLVEIGAFYRIRMEDFFDPLPTRVPYRPVPAEPRRGRQCHHRFTAWSRQAGTMAGGRTKPRHPPPTSGSTMPNPILSWNESPDLGFDRSLNPIAGASMAASIATPARLMHGWGFRPVSISRPGSLQTRRGEPAQNRTGGPGFVCQPIALGTATDAYQPVERTQRLTRALLETQSASTIPRLWSPIRARRPRRRPLVSLLASRSLAAIAVSITGLDSELQSPPGSCAATRSPLTHRCRPWRTLACRSASWSPQSFRPSTTISSKPSSRLHATTVPASPATPCPATQKSPGCSPVASPPRA